MTSINAVNRSAGVAQAAAAVLRKVAWCNVWNRARANDTDGVGSLTHLTASTGVAGDTLCGKSFPRDKGFPSTYRFCKRCLNRAYKLGYAKGFTRQLESVPSVSDH